MPRRFRVANRSPGLAFVDVERGDVPEPARLLARSVDDSWVAMAQPGCQDAAEQIQVLRSLAVLHPAAFALREDERIVVIGC